MSANNDPISKALNLTPMELSNPVQKMLNNALNDSAKSDFETARVNLLELISTIKDSIDNLTVVANASQHPRAYEVLAKLSDSYVQANKDLLELQVVIRNIDAADKPMNGPANITTNNLFVGSTSELQKVLNQIKNG